MRNRISLIIYMLFCLIIKSQGQTCASNPMSIDQYPIVSAGLEADHSASPGSIYYCKGLLNVDFMLNDFSNPGSGGIMPTWFVADVTVVGSGASGNKRYSSITFFQRTLAPPGMSPTYSASISLEGDIDLNIATSINVVIELTSMDPLNGFNPDWDWAYDDPVNCGMMYMGDNMIDMSTPIFYASDATTISVPNAPTQQGIILVRNVTVNPIVNFPNGTYCTETIVNGFFDLLEFTTSPTDMYHYDVMVYEGTATGTKLVGTYTGSPATSVPCGSCLGGRSVPFQFQFPMAVNKSYEFYITNVSVRDGGGNLVTGVDCWEWYVDVAPGFQYGPHSPDHKSSVISIGSKPLPSTCNGSLPFYSGLANPWSELKLNNSVNLGTPENPVSICDLSSPLYLHKALDKATSCYSCFNYSLELQEFNEDYTTAIGAVKVESDIFNCNSTTMVNGSLSNPLNSSGLWGGFLGTLNSVRYFKLLYKGSLNCPDVADTPIHEVYFVYAPSPVTKPIIHLQVNAVGNGKGLNTACCQKAVLVNGGNFGNSLHIASSESLYTSTIRVRLLKSDTSFYKCPDTTINGVLWSSLANATCFPPADFPAGKETMVQPFRILGGNSQGWPLPGAPSTCVSTANCPGNNTDLWTYIFGRTGHPATCYSNSSGTCGVTPEQIGMDRQYFNRSGNDVHLYLEAWTVDKCSGLESERAYLKIKVLEPIIDNPMTINTPNCGNPIITIPANPHKTIRINIDDLAASGWDNERVDGLKFSDFNGSLTPTSNNAPCHNPGYGIPLDPDKGDDRIYVMGKQTGLIEITNPTVGEINVDECVLKISRVLYSKSDADCAWEYIFNPEGKAINFLNKLSGITGQRIQNVKIPINNPYGDYAVNNGGTGFSVMRDLFLNGGSIDMFKSLTANANTSPAYIYKIEFVVVNATNSINKIQSNVKVNGYSVAYFRFRPGTLDNRGTGPILTDVPALESIPALGLARFAIAGKRLHLETSLPEGGRLGYEVYDLQGRRLYHQPERDYPIGVYTESTDLKPISNGVYIVRYRLGGKDHQVKLGAVD